MIREAKESDYLVLMKLYAQLNQDDPISDEVIFKQQLLKIILHPNLFIFVLEQDKEIVASCYLIV